ncbi:MAG: efflux transporter outer membrane subunit [Muribaculum sp.]|nr:efflux transporter outer membrane subunit [Muribaculaceae bacterium]MCM1080928.1 efflux transporter outer membrane subunit [Muribaculum sp.]
MFKPVVALSGALLLLFSVGAPEAVAAVPSADSPLDTIPAHWTYTEHFNQELPDNDSWWRSFNDPLLDSLIAEGIQANYNVVMAARRIEIARQQVLIARAGYMPTVDLSAGWNKSRSSGGLAGNHLEAATVADYFNLGLSMSWEIDVFGKIRTKAKQEKELYKVSRAEYAATMVTLCANIAKSYMQLRMYQEQWQVANEHIASQGKIVKITEARLDAGLASMLDVTQARVVYYSTKSTLPNLEASIHNTINSLAVLLGTYPENVYHRLEKAAPLPDHIALVPIGVPVDLLRRRPDVVEAECNLAASAAALGIAKKEFLPTLTLNGSIGTASHKLGNMFRNPTLTYTIAPTLSWTVFSGMSRRHNAIAAKQQMELQIDNYNLTVLNAVSEVDCCISTYEGSLKTIDLLRQVIQQSQKSLELSLDLYKRGLSPFNNVVTAQQSLLENQNSLISARGSALTAQIALYEALGGGWNSTDL